MHKLTDRPLCPVPTPKVTTHVSCDWCHIKNVVPFCMTLTVTRIQHMTQCTALTKPPLLQLGCCIFSSPLSAIHIVGAPEAVPLPSNT